MTASPYHAGERVTYAIAPCSLGRVLAATTERGVCAIELGDDDQAVVAVLRRHVPNAELRRDDAALRATMDAVVALVDDPAAPFGLPLDVRGTAFQQRVWNALRAVRPGDAVSYGTLARALGSPHAAQAVGAACAANRLAVAIPCHRAVRDCGGLAGYRWGIERKRALLARERGDDDNDSDGRGAAYRADVLPPEHRDGRALQRRPRARGALAANTAGAAKRERAP